MVVVCIKLEIKEYYRESPHRTVKWEKENTVLCETVLFQIEYRDIVKNRLIEKLVLCEDVL